MELRHLRYFVSVAEAASVSKAALRIPVSQPALSRQIRDLETELGVRLFDRLGRRIQLTAEGEELLQRSRDVLAQVQSLFEHAQGLRGGAVGVLRVGAPPQSMQGILAGFLARFHRARPGVEVRLAEAGGARLLDLVERGDLHVALTGFLVGTRLAMRLLFPIRVLAVAPRRERWRRRSTLAVQDVAREPLLVLHRDFGTRQLFDAACRIAHLQPRIVLESREPHSLVALAAAGHGIAIVPSTVQFASRRVRLMPLVQQGESLGTWGGVAWDPRRSLPPYAQEFVEALTTFATRRFPGKQFDRIAPRVPRPAEPVPPLAPASR